MLTPGAYRSKFAPELENDATESESFEAPMLIAVDIHAGKLIPFVNPLLPEATIVAIFADFKLSIAPLITAFPESQLVLFAGPPPKLIFTEAIV